MSEKINRSKSVKRGLAYGSIKEFQADPAKFLTDAINNFIDVSPMNWSVPFQHPYFISPVAIAFANGDSSAFQEIKRKFSWTLTPRECLECPPSVHISTVNGIPKSNIDIPGRNYLPVITENGEITWPKGEPPLPPWGSRKSHGAVASGNMGNSYGEAVANKAPLKKPIEYVTCISVGIPIHPETLEAEASYPWGNSPEMKVHSLVGSHIGFAADITFYIVNLLQMFGHLAIAPTFTAWGQEFNMDFQYEITTSRDAISPCSEREWAVAAGLGTYGLPDMIITEKGMAVILTTIMTSAKIPPSPKPTQEYCLFYRNGSCKQCVSRCPGQAISATMKSPGRLAAKCDAGAVAASNYNNTYLKERMIKEFGDYSNISGNLIWGSSGQGRTALTFPACARCYTDVPCATRIPD